VNNELRDKIVIYRTKDGKTVLDVNLRGETLCLYQSHMSILFDRDRSVITKHLSNIFKSWELDKKSNVQKMHIAGFDKPVAYYKMTFDAIIYIYLNVKKFLIFITQ